MGRGKRMAICRMAVAVLLGAGVAAPGVAAAACVKGAGFAGFLDGIRAEARAAGLSEGTISALDGLRPNPKILGQAKSQKTLSESFLSYSAKLVSKDRLARGRAAAKANAAVLKRAEKEFGVPAPVIVAFWGLESDYGAYLGDADVLRALATLGSDCRRDGLFGRELLAALQLIERGDLARDEMVGSWAGAIGQTQFTPSNYLKYAVDYDGDGRRDLVRSLPDVIASTARFVLDNGWRPGEPWIDEVRVPADFPFEEAGRTIRHPRRFFAEHGVTLADGRPLPKDRLDGGLQLPMGRSGPAFLLYPNFEVFWNYNNSSNYALSGAYLASRLAGAPALVPGNPPKILPADAMREVQERLAGLGYAIGTPDGRLGEQTRTAVRAAQARLGLVPDGYPTAELLERLRAGG